MSLAIGGAIGLSLVASVCWGSADFAGGLAAKRTASCFVVAIAHGSSLILVLLYAAITKAALPSTHTLAMGLVGGAAGGLGLISFYGALSLGEMGVSASIAAVLTATVPVVFSLLTESTPKPAQAVGFVLAGTSVWLIAYTPGREMGAPCVMLAFISGICFGAQLIFLRLAEHGALWPLASSRIASAAVAGLLSLAVLVSRSRPKMPEFGRKNWITAGIAVLAGALDSGEMPFTRQPRLREGLM